MPIQVEHIKLGGYANDGTGDDIRTAFQKIKSTFTLINSELGVSTAANIGSGAGLVSGKVDNIVQVKSLTGTNGVTITSTANSVNIQILAIHECDLVRDIGPPNAPPISNRITRMNPIDKKTTSNHIKTIS